MKKIVDNIYIHRKHFIIKDVQGIYVEGYLEIFPTWNDAKEFINKFEDGTILIINDNGIKVLI